MMKQLWILSLLAVQQWASAQLVLNNNIKVYVSGGTSNSASSTIVLNSPPAIPIRQLGTTTSQGIVLESEWNRLQYNLHQAATAITVPYISNTTGSWVPFPLTVNSITAGTAQAGKTGAIRFSSTHAAALASGWDNYNYRPSSVLNMCGSTGACVNNSNSNDNSANAIDRFWVIQPVNYSAGSNPAVTLNFTYLMMEADANGTGNTAGLAASLQAQRFDTINTGSPVFGWNGFPSTVSQMGTNAPAGSSTATSVGTLTGVVVPSNQFYPAWTLSNTTAPLPIELLNFEANCINNSVRLQWSSATETNASFYTVEKSADGIHYSLLTNIQAAGTTNQITHYYYSDAEPLSPVTYYRLSETDMNGAAKMLKAIVSENCGNSPGEGVTLFYTGEELNLNAYVLSDQSVQINVYDVTGREVYKNDVYALQGKNSFTLRPILAQGIYLFEIQTSLAKVVRKIVIER